VASLPVAKFHGVGPVTAAKMHAVGIETGADLRRQTLGFLGNHFGKSGSWYYELARGQDDRPVQPDRERKSSGSETTFPEDLTDPDRIEAGVIAMADEVWTWCERANSRGRTVTVKIKWADFQQSTRSRSLEAPIETGDGLRKVALALIRLVFPPPKGIRLVGVSLSNFNRIEGAKGMCCLSREIARSRKEISAAFTERHMSRTLHARSCRLESRSLPWSPRKPWPEPEPPLRLRHRRE
jgi:DNA polymerase IV